MAKEKKIRMTILISILILMIAGVGFVVATGFGPGFGGRFGSGCTAGFHKRGMPPFLQQEIGKFILWRMDNQATELGFSKVQQEGYDAFRASLGKTMEQGIDARMEIKKKAVNELQNEVVDLSAMAGELKNHIQVMSQTMTENLTLFTRFYDSLDNGQKQIINQEIKKKIGHGFKKLTPEPVKG